MTKVMSDILRLGNFQISNQDVNIQSRQRQIREKSWSRPKVFLKITSPFKRSLGYSQAMDPKLDDVSSTTNPKDTEVLLSVRSNLGESITFQQFTHSMIHPKVNRTFHLQVPSGRWPTCVGEDEAFDNWLRNPHSVHQGKDAWPDQTWLVNTLWFSEFNSVCPILGTT